jgi:hypothetical protein
MMLAEVVGVAVALAVDWVIMAVMKPAVVLVVVLVRTTLRHRRLSFWLVTWVA